MICLKLQKLKNLNKLFTIMSFKLYPTNETPSFSEINVYGIVWNGDCLEERCQSIAFKLPFRHISVDWMSMLYFMSPHAFFLFF